MAGSGSFSLYSLCRKWIPLLCLFAITSCEKNAASSDNSGEKKILNASFFYPSGFEERDGIIIDEANKRVILHPTYSNSDTNIFKLKFTVSEGAQTSPASESTFDLGSPKTVEVVAGDGSRQTYTVVRSLIAMQAFAYDEAVSTTEFLLLNRVREIRISGSALRMAFGFAQHDANHNITGNKLDLTINDAFANNSIKSGTYDGAAKCAATIEWQHSYFFFGPINSGKVVIEKYDPVLKVCNGRIEDLKHNLITKNGVVTRSISISGYFVNIPVVQ